MTTRIPAELIFHIIGFLHDNKAALSACSLCCSALASVSRPLLFHTLRTGLNIKAAVRFGSLLESSPSILPLIESIDVAIASLEPMAIQRTITAISKIMDCRCAQTTPPTLRFAIRPTLNHFLFTKLVLPYLDPALHWVTSLEIDRLDLNRDIQFWELVLSFPNLKSLTLGRVDVGAMVPIQSHPESKISHITLKETALDYGCNIRWLLVDHSPPLPSLTSLDVRLPAVLDRAHRGLGVEYSLTVRTLRFGVVITRYPTMDWDGFACKF